jgi:regulator-associated protein of mTOR
MGSPSIFVYDCSNAGVIVTCFEQFAEQHEREYLEQV